MEPAEEIRRQKSIVVVSHVDADGLTASAIICKALDRLNLDYKPFFFRQLDFAALDEVANQGADLVVFTDLGSGMIQEIFNRNIRAIVSDHHRVAPAKDTPLGHINPHLVDLDGAVQLSGSTTTFLLARALAKKCGENDDLSALGIVGAVGDLQDNAKGCLVGLNREILEIASKAEAVSFKKDLKLFGKQTRPVFKMLQYSSDPYFPGLSGNEDACIAFLKDIGIPLGGEKWRRWIDLAWDEKARIVSRLLERGISSGISNVSLERLVGEVYTLLKEKEGTELRDASEFSTLLNATARYGHADVGLAVCMGDRDRSLDHAQKLLGEHRQNLVNGLKLVANKGITTMNSIQYFDAGDAIIDTIVGIVAGMAFQFADRSRPILAFARTPEGELKVSARGTQNLVRSGLNLAEALSSSAKAFGGVGGGHNIAAGASIPLSAKQEFLDMIDQVVFRQLMAGK